MIEEIDINKINADVTKLLDLYDQSPNNFINVMAVFAETLANLAPYFYLKYHAVSYVDFTGFLDGLLDAMKESALKNYKELFETEDF